jgi:UDP-GlcNAc3NAcA epimerase
MYMKILTIIGARPQFIKAAMISKEIIEYNHSRSIDSQITEEIIHTGQHYDENMSDIFFSQMKIPEPVNVLNSGGLSHGEMTGTLLIEIEKEIIKRKPDFVLIYGDTNSTLAGALAASKLHVPIVHVEAGLRSFNKVMPEEINRIVTDHLSTLLFCPTESSIKNLKNEGIVQGVTMTGDIMYDAAQYFGRESCEISHILKNLDIKPNCYILSTVHRAENTDNLHNIKSILVALSKIACENTHVILPLHPRTKSIINKFNLNMIIESNKYFRVIEPISFIDMVALERNSSLIITDSGGVQKEAYFHKVPCITLRNETEWIETVENGWNQIVGANEKLIIQAIGNAKKGLTIDDYGNGESAGLMLKTIIEYFHN